MMRLPVLSVFIPEAPFQEHISVMLPFRPKPELLRCAVGCTEISLSHLEVSRVSTVPDTAGNSFDNLCTIIIMHTTSYTDYFIEDSSSTYILFHKDIKFSIQYNG